MTSVCAPTYSHLFSKVCQTSLVKSLIVLLYKYCWVFSLCSLPKMLRNASMKSLLGSGCTATAQRVLKTCYTAVALPEELEIKEEKGGDATDLSQTKAL